MTKVRELRKWLMPFDDCEGVSNGHDFNPRGYNNVPNAAFRDAWDDCMERGRYYVSKAHLWETKPIAV